jgi:tetratricopeptide (TPR) repeat protein
MVDDDADSLMRAIAAAPALAPPERTATVMLVRPSEPGAKGEEVDLVRARVADSAVDVEEREDGLVAVILTGVDHAERAAAYALELRDALPGTAIALATAAIGHGRPAESIIERARALLAATSGSVRLDSETARRVEGQYSTQLANDGSHLDLVEPLGGARAARIGQTLGNYRIVRLLGAGGMGVVYLAEHVTLGRKAVVKFLHERFSTAGELAARFFVEAKTAASIRHPGIVDVFDYGHDERGHGYIVMEYLDGESLRDRLRRQCPLPVELALALGQQIASAVGAAHEAGVIHRDLKPDNIFLVRDPESPLRLRAKVLDFGLAKRATPGESGLTRTGNFVGTPLYMAPEQCRSKEIDARADIYSLGCILFELVCGRVPFVDKTIGDLIIAHNSLPPPSPRSLTPQLPDALERAILRALAKSADDRHTTMAELAAELSSITPASYGFAAPPRELRETPLERPRPARRTRGSRRRLQMVGVAGAGVAIVATLAILASSRWRASSVAAAAGAGATVAVLDLQDAAHQPAQAWLATALGEMLRTDLAASGQLRVAPGADVARMKADLGIADGDAWSGERLGKIGTDLGAQYVVAGSYVASGGQLRVEAAVYSTATGSVLGRSAATGTESDLGGLGLRLAGDIGRALGVDGAGAAPAQAASVLPSHAGAARNYVEGLAAFRRYELTSARQWLERACADDPSDPLVRSALAATWKELGYDSKAAEEAKRAYDHAAALPRENRLAIEAQYRETSAEWDQAIEAYRTLFEFFPTRLDYGLALASAQIHAGDAKSAYATLDALRRVPLVGGDPRIELAEAEAAEAADDIDRERVHAERAAVLARARGARVLLAKALFHHGWALWQLGRNTGAEHAYEEAKQIFSAVGDRSGVARCLNNMALAAHRDRHDADATRAYAEALRLAREIGDTITQAWVLNNWAFMLTDQGELARALELYGQKLELGGARGDGPASQAAAHANIAEILRWRGDLDGARTHARAAEDLLRGLDARRFAAFTAYQLGALALAEDDLAGSRKRLEQALGWASDVMRAEIRIALARTELESGHPAQAEALSRAALDELRALGDTREQVCAAAVIATALVALGRGQQASRELASVPASDDVSLTCRLEAELATARIMASDPAQRAAAIAGLHTAGERAAKLGFVELELEIQLLRASLGDEDPRALVRGAQARGFRHVAHQAGELARKPHL